MKFILLLFLFTNTLVAQWSNDPTVNTSVVVGTGDQKFINCTGDGEGGIIIAWVDAPSGFYNYDIYAQKLDKYGNPQWAINGIPVCTATQNQYDPVLIGDGAGGAIIAWLDVRSTAYVDIYAQRISAAGEPQWASDGIEICTAAEVQKNIRIVSDGSGGAIMVWQDYRNGSSNPDIYAQKVSNGGVGQWGSNGTPVCTASEYQVEPVITSDETGGAIIAWDDDRGGESDIYAQKVNASGNMMWNNDGIIICNATDYQMFPQIVHDGTGGAFIAWEDYRNEIYYLDVYAQWINSSGNAQWQNNGVAVSTADRDQSNIKIINDNSGGTIISWEDDRTYDIEFYAQRLNSQGNTQWTANGILITSQPTDAKNHVLNSDGSGGAIIVWQDGTTGNYHINAQKINGAGIFKWNTDGIAITSANISQENPCMVSDLAGGVIVSWEDSRNAPQGNGDDVYAQQVSTNGNLGEIISGVETVKTFPADYSLAQNYPNPFNPGTNIEFNIPQLSFVTVEIFSELGQKIDVLVSEKLSPGLYDYRWNAGDHSSGVYFYRLQTENYSETKKMILLH